MKNKQTNKYSLLLKEKETENESLEKDILQF